MGDKLFRGRCQFFDASLWLKKWMTRMEPFELSTIPVLVIQLLGKAEGQIGNVTFSTIISPETVAKGTRTLHWYRNGAAAGHGRNRGMERFELKMPGK